MKKIYTTPKIDVIEAETTGIIAASLNNVVTFGNKSNDVWQNEEVEDGYLDDGNMYSEIEDDTWGLSSR